MIDFMTPSVSVASIFLASFVPCERRRRDRRDRRDRARSSEIERGEVSRLNAFSVDRFVLSLFSFFFLLAIFLPTLLAFSFSLVITKNSPRHSSMLASRKSHEIDRFFSFQIVDL